MPNLSAARRASLLSSIEQQPRDPVRYSSRLRLSAMWTPTTSCPASTARAAATAESTPPDKAARTRMGTPGDKREPVHRTVAVRVARVGAVLHFRPSGGSHGATSQTVLLILE